MITRDRFAFAALAVLLNSEIENEVIVDEGNKTGDTAAVAADLAYTFGDAMLARSEK